jgi:VIT1/CCC1 family predicted Fe2+/Mn2+ transporter
MVLSQIGKLVTREIEQDLSRAPDRSYRSVLGNLRFRELDQGRLAEKVAFGGRITMAMFGGVALIVPMVIMTLNPSNETSLITVAAATILVALLLAVYATDSTGKDVLAATAAYAAVLVVFVGNGP